MFLLYSISSTIFYLVMNTPFTKENIYKSGQYLFTNSDVFPDRFIARFKYTGGPITKSAFIKELIKNHTMEEYFGILEHEDYSKRRAPLQILREKNPLWYKATHDRWLTKQMAKKSVASSYEII